MHAAHGVGKHPRHRRDYKVTAGCPRLVERRASPPDRTGETPVPPLSDRTPCPALYWNPMRPMLRFLWNSTRGHRIAPWRSPYLLWRIETFTGVKMTQIGFLEFWEFLWTERKSLWRVFEWAGEEAEDMAAHAEKYLLTHPDQNRPPPPPR